MATSPPTIIATAAIRATVRSDPNRASAVGSHAISASQRPMDPNPAVDTKPASTKPVAPDITSHEPQAVSAAPMTAAATPVQPPA